MSIYGNPVMMGGSGGGGGSSNNPDIHMIGSFGGPGMDNASSVTVTITGFSGTTALIAVVHRDTITAPSECTLLDNTIYASTSGNQWISVFKATVNSNNATFTFNQNTTTRIGATAWTLNTDFTLTKKLTDYYEFFSDKLSVYTDYLAFLVFQSRISNTETQKMSYAVSDGAWLCQGIPVEYQLRHFSGIIYPTQASKETKIWQEVYPAITGTSIEGQVVVYQITPI